MHFMGIDIGSLTCGTVIIDNDCRIVGSAVTPTGARNREAAARARKEALDGAGLTQDDVSAIISTGYGRDRVEDRIASVTEITCHARGIKELRPGTKLLIDVGGQDSKAILLDENGKVADFAMNDKCAAGTGRFFEVMARTLEVDLEDLGDLDAKASKDVSISSICTVFAESEVVSLIADGTDPADIVRGLHRSVGSRVAALATQVIRGSRVSPVAMSGGVAKNSGMVRALGRVLGAEIAVPPDPDLVGALGAALIAHARF